MKKKEENNKTEEENIQCNIARINWRLFLENGQVEEKYEWLFGRLVLKSIHFIDHFSMIKLSML